MSVIRFYGCLVSGLLDFEVAQFQIFRVSQGIRVF